MRVEDFSKRLFTTLAHQLIAEINLDVSKENESTKKKPICSKSNDDVLEKNESTKKKHICSKSNDDVLEKNESTKKKPICSKSNNESTKKKKHIYSKSNEDVSRSVLMLSYVFRPAFREYFIEVFPILNRKIGNFMIYIRCFAEVLHKKYSPLNFLVLCSFISEIVRFLSDHQLLKTKRRYVEKTTGALNRTFHLIFERDFPENGWRDIKEEASKIANGFKSLEPFMNKENLDVKPISRVVNAILIDSPQFKHKCRQTRAMKTERYMQPMASANITHNESFTPSAKASVNISEIGVPIHSDENFVTNENARFPHDQFYTATFSFGTIDEDGEASILARSSDFIFEYPPSGMGRHSPKIDETTNSKSESKEHLPIKNSEKEIEPYFRTIKKIENGAHENSAENNGVVCEKELIDYEAQFWETFLATDSEEELEPPINVRTKTENLGTEGCISTNKRFSEEQSIYADVLFWKDKLISTIRTEMAEDVIEQCFLCLDENSETFSKEENGCLDVSGSEKETFSKEKNADDSKSVTLAREENADDSKSETIAREENADDSKSETIAREENADDSKSETIAREENADDSKSETIAREENADDSKSETFAEENTLVTGNAINISDNQPETFHQIQSNAPLQLFNANEKVSLQDAQQANKIETNFRTDEMDLSTKVLHLNLGGEKCVLQMPANITLIFEYKGSIVSS